MNVLLDDGEPTMNPIMQRLRSHRSIRKFTDQPVDDDMINDIIQCGQSAATSSNIQATTVIRVRKDATRREIAKIAGDQHYVTTSGAFPDYNGFRGRLLKPPREAEIIRF